MQERNANFFLKNGSLAISILLSYVFRLFEHTTLKSALKFLLENYESLKLRFITATFETCYHL